MLFSDLDYLEYRSALPKVTGGSDNVAPNNYVFLSLKNGILSLTVNDRQIVNNRPLTDLPSQQITLPLTDSSFIWVSSSSQAVGENVAASSWVAVGVAPHHSSFFPFGLSAIVAPF